MSVLVNQSSSCIIRRLVITSYCMWFTPRIHENWKIYRDVNILEILGSATRIFHVPIWTMDVIMINVTGRERKTISNRLAMTELKQVRPRGKSYASCRVQTPKLDLRYGMWEGLMSVMTTVVKLSLFSSSAMTSLTNSSLSPRWLASAGYKQHL